MSVNYALHIFAARAKLKFQFVRAAVSKIHFQAVTTK